MTSYQISIQKGNLILVWKLLTATSFYFASANSPIIVLFIYLFISHMQQVVFWTIWNILYLGGGGGVYCLLVCFFSNQSNLSLNWLGATFSATVWTCFHNKLSGACLLMAQGWETELYFLSWDMLQKPVTVHFHWLQWTYHASLIRWPHIYSLINVFNMLPNQEELAGVLSTSICRLTY